MSTISASLPVIPQSWHVAGNSLYRTHESDEAILDDPRGFLHVWEEPQRRAKYIVGMDPTVGITGWSRALRREGDHKIDNAAIEVYRIDALKRLIVKDGKPVIDPYTKIAQFVWRDLQVAEYFAPIDSVESARVVNVIGRIYAGEDDDQAELIYESYPGPGVLTTQELLRLGYGNLWHWEYIATSVAEETRTIGWQSTPRSQQLLWARARRHLMSGQAKIMSPWLLDEYRNLVIDPERMRAVAASGAHDDMVQASDMCFWAGHKWAYDAERTDQTVTETPDVDWQRRAPVLGEEHVNYKEAWSAAVDNWDV